MSLVEITPEKHNVKLSILYASENNFTGAPVYTNSDCYLHKDAEKCLLKSSHYANCIGLRLKIFDGFRPTEAQELLWKHSPNPEFLADPNIGSPHSKGIAVDLTLINEEGRELEMGTDFDSFKPESHHGDLSISVKAQQNRLLLLGIMTLAGWDFYQNEWWHYQLPNSNTYPLLNASLMKNFKTAGAEGKI
ncbi:MAG: D-alanyl-D-alanine dipeptidase [Pseudomonadota bacterium]|nr:D-alanyl-D-alanine dipeptidase [Pseudomonadota bacterium]